MTKEEIKESITIMDICRRYGLHVNAKGFCRCPFHGDKHPSMRIYTNNNSFYCFVCHKGGDIFKFVEFAENTDFKGALKILGGESYDSKAKKEWEEKKLAQERELARLEKKKEELNEIIEIARKGLKMATPLSDEWVVFTNTFEDYMGRWEMVCDEIKSLKSHDLTV